MRWFKRIARPTALLVILAISPFVAQEAALGAEASYVDFLVPGALGTYPMGVSNSLAVAGYYTTSPSTAAGFVRLSNGAITTFSIAGSLWTEPESINSLGDITGFYAVVAGTPQGFVRYANGRIVTFDPPPGQIGLQAQPVDINRFGEIAGNYPSPNSASAGFTRSRTGTFTRLAYSQGGSYPTGVMGLNSNGAVVGYTSDTNPYIQAQGFLLHPDGYMVKFSVPVPGPIASQSTFAEDINDEGTIAGWYGTCTTNCVSKTSGGFVLSPQGDFTLFSPPGTLVPPQVNGFFTQSTSSLSAPKTLSLNAAGVIAGTYKDVMATQHGFVRNPYGTITSFDPPRGMQTTATSINDSGVIAGSFYYDWNSQASIGFLRIPKP